MNTVKKFLFIVQETEPFLDPSPFATLCRELVPKAIDSGAEARTFMPKWGLINERRNQLHEVIRLSGQNIIIDRTDHNLLIKVASVQGTRMQVYFIDNDEYFGKRGFHADAKGVEYKDNPERATFFARGVIETVKKWGWVPDVVHCVGWVYPQGVCHRARFPRLQDCLYAFRHRFHGQHAEESGRHPLSSRRHDGRTRQGGTVHDGRF